MIAGAFAVLWVRQDGPGNDACRFADADGGFLIDGSSTDADWNVLRYRVRARADGTTRRARVGRNYRSFIRRAPDDSWTLNDTPVPEVAGARDVDLGFTPATLTLPVRRLRLAPGEEADLLVAHFDFDDKRLFPLHRTYRHLGEGRYECDTAETGETIRFRVDRDGIVRELDGRWKAQK